MEDNDRIRRLLKQFRTTGWMLYVPGKVYAAHRAGLLPYWHVGVFGRRRTLNNLVSFLGGHSISLKIPWWQWQWVERRTMEHPPEFLVCLHVDVSQCPPLPEHAVTDDRFWNFFLERFDLAGKGVTHKTLAYESWAYTVRFFPIVVNQMGARVSYPDSDDIRREGLTEDQVVERKEACKAERRRVENEVRRLRKEFNLSVYYTDDGGKSFPGTLVVLRRAYPPEQVRRIRRKIESALRRDPAEVISYGLRRGLVK